VSKPVATKKKALKGARFGARKREAGALHLAYAPRRALSGDTRLGGTGGAEVARKWGRGAEATWKRGESRQRARNHEAWRGSFGGLARSTAVVRIGLGRG
jgi:hypothetical protein